MKILNYFMCFRAANIARGRKILLAYRETVQFFLEIGMRNFDKSLDSLANRLAVEIGNSEFCNDVMYVAAGRGYPCTFRQPGYDAGDTSVPGSGGERDD